MMIEEGPAHRDLTHRDHRTHHQAVKAAGADRDNDKSSKDNSKKVD
jgi:hypothetical protein